MGFWWSGDADENVFMEITGRSDVGTYLRAPLTARGGVSTPGYALVGEVAAGDIVVHYDSGAGCIIGVSRATGERLEEPIWWAARGSYARKAGVEPQWLPGLTVVLDGFRPLAPGLPVDEIRRRCDALFAVRDALEAEHPSQPLYFPWTRYGDSLRTFQTYIAKVPRAVLPVLPELAEVVAAVEQPSDADPSLQPEIAAAERSMAAAAGRPHEGNSARGQGWSTDQDAKVAVETHAMNQALDYFRHLGTITDTSRHESYDYEVAIGEERWHVEVKGTTGDPLEVLLTPNEVRHAHDYPHVALFVLGNIEIVRDDAGQVTTTGGTPIVHMPWRLDAACLSPIGYKYRLDP